MGLKMGKQQHFEVNADSPKKGGVTVKAVEPKLETISKKEEATAPSNGDVAETTEHTTTGDTAVEETKKNGDVVEVETPAATDADNSTAAAEQNGHDKTEETNGAQTACSESDEKKEKSKKVKKKRSFRSFSFLRREKKQKEIAAKEKVEETEGESADKPQTASTDEAAPAESTAAVAAAGSEDAEKTAESESTATAPAADDKKQEATEKSPAPVTASVESPAAAAADVEVASRKLVDTVLERAQEEAAALHSSSDGAEVSSDKVEDTQVQCEGVVSTTVEDSDGRRLQTSSAAGENIQHLPAQSADQQCDAKVESLVEISDCREENTKSDKDVSEELAGVTEVSSEPVDKQGGTPSGSVDVPTVIESSDETVEVERLQSSIEQEQNVVVVSDSVEVSRESCLADVSTAEFVPVGATSDEHLTPVQTNESDVQLLKESNKADIKSEELPCSSEYVEVSKESCLDDVSPAECDSGSDVHASHVGSVESDVQLLNKDQKTTSDSEELVVQQPESSDNFQCPPFSCDDVSPESTTDEIICQQSSQVECSNDVPLVPTKIIDNQDLITEKNVERTECDPVSQVEQVDEESISPVRQDSLYSEVVPETQAFSNSTVPVASENSSSAPLEDNLSGDSIRSGEDCVESSPADSAQHASEVVEETSEIVTVPVVDDASDDVEVRRLPVTDDLSLCQEKKDDEQEKPSEEAAAKEDKDESAVTSEVQNGDDKETSGAEDTPAAETTEEAAEQKKKDQSETSTEEQPAAAASTDDDKSQ